MPWRPHPRTRGPLLACQLRLLHPDWSWWWTNLQLARRLGGNRWPFAPWGRHVTWKPKKPPPLVPNLKKHLMTQFCSAILVKHWFLQAYNCQAFRRVRLDSRILQAKTHDAMNRSQANYINLPSSNQTWLAGRFVKKWMLKKLGKSSINAAWRLSPYFRVHSPGHYLIVIMMSNGIIIYIYKIGYNHPLVD